MESFWTTAHITLILTVFSGISVVWLDLRHEAKKNRDAVIKNQLTIEKRFTALEVMIEPLWDWFTNGRK